LIDAAVREILLDSDWFQFYEQPGTAMTKTVHQTDLPPALLFVGNSNRRRAEFFAQPVIVLISGEYEYDSARDTPGV